MNSKFIKSRVNKVEESYRSPISQECFPLPVSNYFIPINVTKIERNFNMLAEEYCAKLYLRDFITSIFVSMFNKNQSIHFMVLKELPADGQFLTGGVYQVRISIEADQSLIKYSGVVEYKIHVRDKDGSRRCIDGSIFRSEETKYKLDRSDRSSDPKTFNYKEVGVCIAQLESFFFMTLHSLVCKSRLSVGEEMKRIMGSKSEMRSLIRSAFMQNSKEPGMANSVLRNMKPLGSSIGNQRFKFE